MKLLLIVVLLVVAGASVLLWGNTNDATVRSPGVNVNTERNGEPAREVEGENETVLSLSAQGLTKVPADVFTQTELIELDLSNNQLTGALQAEVRHLQNLKVLDLSDNQFTGVPAEIGQLESLEILDLSNNQLTGLPNELGNLSKLTQLNISGNTYSQSDLAIIKKSLPATTVIIVD